MVSFLCIRAETHARGFFANFKEKLLRVRASVVGGLDDNRLWLAE
jgi:hypothetical protein